MSAITSLDKQTFENLIKNSKTWTEVMIYFRDNHGYTNIKSGKTAKKRCIKENISFSHIDKNTKNTSLINVNITVSPNPDTKKPYCPKKLKEKLFKEGLLKEICSECGLGPMWEGAPIVLQLEHIDGDHYNNEITNLTILCPNCHSQTPTWCGKSVDTKKYNCINCKTKISGNSDRCRSCSALNRHKKE